MNDPHPAVHGPNYGGITSSAIGTAHVYNVPAASAPPTPAPRPPTPVPTAGDPSRLRILLATSAPTPEPRDDGTVEWLDSARELRDITEKLRLGDLDGRITLDVLSAATPSLLMAGLNRRPDILHLAARSDANGVLLDAEGGGGAIPMPFDVLGAVLGGNDRPPRLVVLNACWDPAGAQLLLRCVPVVIGIPSGSPGTASATFARTFYAAVAAGQPIGRALEQGRTGLRLGGMPDVEPQVRARSGVELGATRLIDA